MWEETRLVNVLKLCCKQANWHNNECCWRPMNQQLRNSVVWISVMLMDTLPCNLLFSLMRNVGIRWFSKTSVAELTLLKAWLRKRTLAIECGAKGQRFTESAYTLPPDSHWPDQATVIAAVPVALNGTSVSSSYLCRVGVDWNQVGRKRWGKETHHRNYVFWGALRIYHKWKH